MMVLMWSLENVEIMQMGICSRTLALLDLASVRGVIKSIITKVDSVSLQVYDEVKKQNYVRKIPSRKREVKEKHISACSYRSEIP